jgi:hypothetical protein
MIVRILNGGQYRVDAALFDRLNEIDNRIVEAVAKNDEKRMKELLGEMLAVVKRNGKPIDAREIVPSDVILPPDDLTMDEAVNIFAGSGLIPD